MAAKQSTSIQFYDEIKPLKDDLSAIFGLKNLVSAGVLLFSRLNSDCQKKIIKEVSGISTEPLQVFTETQIRKLIRDELVSQGLSKGQVSETKENLQRRLDTALKNISKSAYQLLSESDSAILNDIRHLLGPEPLHKTKKGTG